ncbi:hypothetical protein BC829DRAFT_279497 [Chytridium lagenaria]|nr:hypothetical protein BC829DRAFT_279497 [Chytridium lagenaria]
MEAAFESVGDLGDLIFNSSYETSQDSNDALFNSVELADQYFFPTRHAFSNESTSTSPLIGSITPGSLAAMSDSKNSPMSLGRAMDDTNSVHDLPDFTRDANLSALFDFNLGKPNQGSPDITDNPISGLRRLNDGNSWLNHAPTLLLTGSEGTMHDVLIPGTESAESFLEALGTASNTMDFFHSSVASSLHGLLPPMLEGEGLDAALPALGGPHLRAKSSPSALSSSLFHHTPPTSPTKTNPQKRHHSLINSSTVSPTFPLKSFAMPGSADPMNLTNFQRDNVSLSGNIPPNIQNLGLPPSNMGMQGFTYTPPMFANHQLYMPYNQAPNQQHAVPSPMTQTPSPSPPTLTSIPSKPNSHITLPYQHNRSHTSAPSQPSSAALKKSSTVKPKPRKPSSISRSPPTLSGSLAPKSSAKRADSRKSTKFYTDSSNYSYSVSCNSLGIPRASVGMDELIKQNNTLRAQVAAAKAVRDREEAESGEMLETLNRLMGIGNMGGGRRSMNPGN